MYFTHGVIKTTENHPDEWFDNYKIEFNDSLISEFTNHEFNFLVDKSYIKLTL